MPNADWFPDRQLEQQSWYTNFKQEVLAIAALLKLDPAIALAATEAWLGGYGDWTKKRTAADGAAATLQGLEKPSADAVRAFVRLLKATPGVTPTMLATLRCATPDADPTTHVDAQVPNLKMSELGGHPSIGFTKHGHQGIILYSRRPDAGETEFEKLGLDTHSPYVDTRPSGVPGKPETREYCACYAHNDEPAGPLGPIFTVTVRG